MQAAPFLTRSAAHVAAAAIVLPRRTAARRPPDGNAEYGVLHPELATVYAGQVDPALCFVSEKCDGVRALWDGSTLRHRSGRSLAAPAWFLAALPREPLDGELWLGRGRFEPLSALVRRRELRDADWQAVRYMMFDTPIAGPSFAGATVTYRYRELTSNGLPRFGTYLRRHRED